MKIIKRTALAMACAGAMTVAANTAQAANWLMLQGTEPEGAAKPVNVWGFVQADYQADNSTPRVSNQGLVPPKLIGPNLTSQS
ncbi:MAG: phosphate-selective porin O and P, partial [Pseudomonadota bacterium]